jgi:hypothetical protein
MRVFCKHEVDLRTLQSAKSCPPGNIDCKHANLLRENVGKIWGYSVFSEWRQHTAYFNPLKHSVAQVFSSHFDLHRSWKSNLMWRGRKEYFVNFVTSDVTCSEQYGCCKLCRIFNFLERPLLTDLLLHFFVEWSELLSLIEDVRRSHKPPTIAHNCNCR